MNAAINWMAWPKTVFKFQPLRQSCWLSSMSVTIIYWTYLKHPSLVVSPTPKGSNEATSEITHHYANSRDFMAGVNLSWRWSLLFSFFILLYIFFISFCLLSLLYSFYLFSIFPFSCHALLWFLGLIFIILWRFLLPSSSVISILSAFLSRYVHLYSNAHFTYAIY